jgi:hypothetical protein
MTVPKYGPSTDSDLAEKDDFVRAQLLLAHALEIGFNCEKDPVTVFRDDLLGLGLLWVEGSRRHPDGFVMQALCHRPHDHAPWRVVEFSPAWVPRSRWMSYKDIHHADLGVAVEPVPPGTMPTDEALVVEVHDVAYRVRWDVPPPT